MIPNNFFYIETSLMESESDIICCNKLSVLENYLIKIAKSSDFIYMIKLKHYDKADEIFMCGRAKGGVVSG